jgi:arylsulfatase A-like enzyme
MPFLDRLGERRDGLAFRGHYSHWPQTMKSLFSLLCSELPHPDYAPITYTNPGIPCVSLAEALKNAGYQTALFSSGDFAYDRQLRFLKHRRFDHLVDRHRMPGQENAWSNTWGVDEKVTVRAVLSWMSWARREGGADKPFFAIYNVATGHHPYEIPGSPPGLELDAAAETAAQRAALSYVDNRLAELFEGLRAGGFDDTLVAVVSDHGPGSGRQGMGRVRDASIYEGSVHVPLVLVGPQLAGIGGGPAIRFPTSHIDLAPTLLGLLDIEPPLTMKGRDLSRQSDDRAIIMATRPPLAQIGVREGPWKYVLWQETGAVELFNIDTDPAELADRSSDNPEVVSRLGAIGARWRTFSRNLIENYASVLRSRGRRCPGTTLAR